MLPLLGASQQKLLKLLQISSEGKSIDQLVNELGISRNAVQQHLASLEKNNFIEIQSIKKTGGRPSRHYSLTVKGQELFPKQYPWFSGLMLQAIKAEKGSEGLTQFLKNMASTLAKEIKKNFEGKTQDEKITEVVNVMQSLSYDARSVPVGVDSPNAIEATNCVYHELAKVHPEVCQFDLELLSQVLDSKINHEECILRQNGKCRFTLSKS